nr:pyruvate kinase [Mycoplasmoides pirum]
MNHLKRTKIVATCGPSLTQKIWTLGDLKDPKNKELVKKAYENIENVIRNGVTTIRLNFSHGSQEEQLIRIQIVREVSKKLQIPVSIMLDTQGPEIRVGKIVDEGCKINAKDLVEIYTSKVIVGSKNKFYASDSTGKYNMINDLKVGSTILVDDGKLNLTVKKLDKKLNIITCEAKNTHTITSRKRINLPNAHYSIPFLSQKDENDILFGIKNNVDYLALSFVNTVKDIKQVKEILKKNNAEHIKIISKIESTHAINNLDAIIDASDAIMVARGDLSLEIPYYVVPYWQRYIIKACRDKNKQVIVATQMLDSLEKNIHPTRAEVTDVYFAVDRGTDATMLSGETANGLYPLVAVEVMNLIDKQSEISFDYERAINYYFPKTKLSKTKFGKLVLDVAKKVCPKRNVSNADFKYDFIVHFTNDLNEIKTLSNIRPAAGVIIITDNDQIYTGHGIDYGIFTYKVENLKNAKKDWKEVSLAAINKYKKFGIIKSKLPNLVLVNNKIVNLKG